MRFLRRCFDEVEGIINGRPITKVSMDVNDSAALIPNYLLLLKGDYKVVPGVFNLVISTEDDGVSYKSG